MEGEGKGFETILEKSANEIKESVKRNIDPIKADVEGLQKDISHIKQQAEEAIKDGRDWKEYKNQLDNSLAKWHEKQGEMQKQLDILDVKSQKAFGSPVRHDTFENVLAKGIEANIDKFQAKVQKSLGFDFNIEINSKAVGDMGTGNATASNLTSGFIQPAYAPGLVYDPLEQPILRSLIASGAISSNRIIYAKYMGGEGSPDVTAEGATKPQFDFDFEMEERYVKKIAGHARVSEEMLEDIGFMSSFISNMAQQELKLKEENEILTGDGTGQHLNGILSDAAAFAAGALAGKVPNGLASYIDVLRAAISQVLSKRYRPDTILLHPTDLTLMKLEKEGIAGSKRTLVPSTLDNPIPSIDGVRVVTSAEMTQGEFLVGAFRTASQLFDRQQINVRFFDQDRDNPIKNLVTVVVEERLVLATYRPNAYAYGTFAGAITALEAAAS